MLIKICFFILIGMASSILIGDGYHEAKAYGDKSKLVVGCLLLIVTYIFIFRIL